MKKKSYFAKEQDRVNNTFFSADGFSDDNFYGSEYSSADGFADNFYGNDYSNADAAPAPAMRVAKSNPYTFQIANSAAVNLSNVVLLGANQNTVLGTTNFGNTGVNASVTITQLNGSISYAQFLQMIKTQSFMVGEIQLQSTNTTAPFLTFSVAQTEPDGRTSTVPYYPILNKFQQQNGVSSIEQLIPVNGNTQFLFSILSSDTLTVRLFPCQTVDVSRAVVDRPVAVSYNNPRINAQTLTLGKGNS